MYNYEGPVCLEEEPAEVAEQSASQYIEVFVAASLSFWECQEQSEKTGLAPIVKVAAEKITLQVSPILEPFPIVVRKDGYIPWGFISYHNRTCKEDERIKPEDVNFSYCFRTNIQINSYNNGTFQLLQN